MNMIAEVRLWNTTIGAVSLESGSPVASFEYSPDFIQSGIQVSPLVMPLSNRIYRFPALPAETFHGLPGLLADSLPDRFGNSLIDAWLARQGRSAGSFNAVERLCYTGTRGLGALEFHPVTGPDQGDTGKIDIARLVELASNVLKEREKLQGAFTGDEEGMKQILRVGTSAGGARAKAVIAFNPVTGEIRSGQVQASENFEYWILKFDGVTNRDHELNDPQGFGAIEYAYYRMAQSAGIVMSECHLLEENNRRHFMTRRFDRTAEGKKIHMQSLCALAHFDFNAPGAYSYEQAFSVIRRIIPDPVDALEQMFRRMVFNILARNQDDHVKNTAFLMDRKGAWTLAPAFDMTYSYNPGGLWTGSHQMTLNGKRDGFIIDDFFQAAKSAGLRRSLTDQAFNDVKTALLRWEEFAIMSKIPENDWRTIQKNFRLTLNPKKKTGETR
jgi:serine/threonine-protein kinase HipA